MILSFEPPRELVEFSWEAACAAAHAASDPAGLVTPLQIIAPHYSRRVAMARRVFAVLVRRHVWCETVPNGTQGRLPLSIVFGEMPPFPEEHNGHKPVPITLPMLGWLVGRCHSTFVKSLAKGAPGELLAAAESHLAEVYPPGRIIAEATFRERHNRIRDW